MPGLEAVAVAPNTMPWQPEPRSRMATRAEAACRAWFRGCGLPAAQWHPTLCYGSPSHGHAWQLEPRQPGVPGLEGVAVAPNTMPWQSEPRSRMATRAEAACRAWFRGCGLPAAQWHSTLCHGIEIGRAHV